MKRYRQIHTVVSDTSLLSIHISIIFDSFVTFDCIKESFEMNCRTFVPGSFCFFVKYRTIIINGVIDYRVFRYRLKVSISHLLLTRAKMLQDIKKSSHRDDSGTCKQNLFLTNIKKVIFTFVFYYIKSCNSFNAIA